MLKDLYWGLSDLSTGFFLKILQKVTLTKQEYMSSKK